MVFVYHKEAGAAQLTLGGEGFKHVFLARRGLKGARLAFRNLQDHFLYTYQVSDIRKREAEFILLDSVLLPVRPMRFSHVIIALIDVRALEKTLPLLNQLGLSRLSLFYASRSQRNFRTEDLIRGDRLHKILINSCQQCGRSELMEVELLDDLEHVLRKYPMASVLDFNGEAMDGGEIESGVIIGPEGGFSESEKASFKTRKIVRLGTPMVLRSEVAALSVVAKGI